MSVELVILVVHYHEVNIVVNEMLYDMGVAFSKTLSNPIAPFLQSFASALK